MIYKITHRTNIASILFLAVCALLLLSLSGCGMKQNADKSVTERTYNTESVAPDDELAVSDETKPDNDNEWGNEIRGTVEDNVYTSKIGDLKLTLDESWTYLSDNEMAKNMRFTAAEYDEQAWYNYCIGELYTLYDAWAVNEDGSIIIITIENTGFSDSEVKQTDESYASMLVVAMRREMDKLTVNKFGSIKINGSDCYWTTMYGKKRGNSAERGYLVKKVDDYMICVGITAVPGYTKSSEEILCMFDGVEGLDEIDAGSSEESD